MTKKEHDISNSIHKAFDEHAISPWDRAVELIREQGYKMSPQTSRTVAILFDHIRRELTLKGAI
ncbi:MAG: hypothetical protein GX585_06020 [Clostridiales bacterium]|nr:hypothetical protein [Clostridiales bacterium]